MPLQNADSSACLTVRELLDRRAAERPEQCLLRFDQGGSWTAEALRQRVRTLAQHLLDLGINKADKVLLWLPNSPLCVHVFLALNYIGAIPVPINTAYKGRLLEHAVSLSGARLMVVDGRLLGALATVQMGRLDTLLISGPERLDASHLQQLSVDGLELPPEMSQDIDMVPLAPWDTQAVLFTSGTTGPSKGVLCSYQHLYTAAVEFRHVGPGDCNLVALPMFHVGGILGLLFALIHGGCAAFIDRFRTEDFWEVTRRMEVTTVGLLGAMVQFLMQQAPSREDRNHSVRTAVIAPLSDDALAFSERFGIDVYTEFNMTELSVPLYCGPNPQVRGTCGRPRSGLDIRLVDEHDIPVPMGEVGELVLRSDQPWTLSHGYLNAPESTARTWRNGWFHTGDLFRRDANDYYFFVDRAKDMIRRRGENISSFEVEEALLAYPDISDAAVVAVPGDGGEDEILACLVTDNQALPELHALIDFLEPRLAHFMVPRYFRVLERLPRTPSQKVEKHTLRSSGITAETIDREAIGIRLHPQTLSARGES